jgi:hypothetical protein
MASICQIVIITSRVFSFEALSHYLLSILVPEVAWFPRIQEAMAAIRHIVRANANTMVRPCINGPEIRSGKKLGPVSIA